MKKIIAAGIPQIPIAIFWVILFIMLSVNPVLRLVLFRNKILPAKSPKRFGVTKPVEKPARTDLNAVLRLIFSVSETIIFHFNDSVI